MFVPTAEPRVSFSEGPGDPAAAAAALDEEGSGIAAGETAGGVSSEGSASPSSWRVIGECYYRA